MIVAVCSEIVHPVQVIRLGRLAKRHFATSTAASRPLFFFTQGESSDVVLDMFSITAQTT